MLADQMDIAVSCALRYIKEEEKTQINGPAHENLRD